MQNAPVENSQEMNVLDSIIQKEMSNLGLLSLMHLSREELTGTASAIKVAREEYLKQVCEHLYKIVLSDNRNRIFLNDTFVLTFASFFQNPSECNWIEAVCMQPYVALSYSAGTLMKGNENKDEIFFQQNQQMFFSSFPMFCENHHAMKNAFFLLNNWKMFPDFLCWIVNEALLRKSAGMQVDWRSSLNQVQDIVRFIHDHDEHNGENSSHASDTHRRDNKSSFRYKRHMFFHNALHSTIVQKIRQACLQADAYAMKKKNTPSLLLQNVNTDSKTKKKKDEQNNSNARGKPDTPPLLSMWDEYQLKNHLYFTTPQTQGDKNVWNNTQQREFENGLVAKEDRFSIVPHPQISSSENEGAVQTAKFNAAHLWDRLDNHAEKLGNINVPLKRHILASEKDMQNFYGIQEDKKELYASIFGSHAQMPATYESRMNMQPWSCFTHHQKTCYNKEAVQFLETFFQAPHDQGEFSTASCNIHELSLAFDNHAHALHNQYPQASMFGAGSDSLLSIQWHAKPSVMHIAFAKIVTINGNYLYNIQDQSPNMPAKMSTARNTTVPKIVTTTDVQHAKIYMPFQWNPVQMHNSMEKNVFQHPKLIKSFLSLAMQGQQNVHDMENLKKRANLEMCVRKKMKLQEDIRNLKSETENIKNMEKVVVGDIQEYITVMENKIAKLMSIVADLEKYINFFSQENSGNDFKVSISDECVSMETIQISPGLYFYWVKFDNGVQCGMSLHTQGSLSNPLLEKPGRTLVFPSKIPEMSKLLEDMKQKCAWFSHLQFWDGNKKSIYDRIQGLPDKLEGNDALKDQCIQALRRADVPFSSMVQGA